MKAKGGRPPATTTCPYCEAEIDALDVNPDRQVARCTSCATVFRSPDRRGPESAGSKEWDFDPPRPKGLDVEEADHELRLEHAARKSDNFRPLVGITAGLNTLLVAVVALVPLGAGGMLILGFFWFPVCLLLLVGTVQMAIQKTVVTVDRRRITVTQRRFGSKVTQIDTAEVLQLYARPAKMIGPRHRNPNQPVDLCAVTMNGAHTCLIQAAPNETFGLYAEWMIERFLGIPDRPVHGELRS